MIRVAVLGATGFVGRNVAEAFATDPAYEVIAVRHKRPAFSYPRIAWIDADLTTDAGVAAALDGAHVVVHAAAATAGSAANLDDPLSLVVDNQVMTARIFAAAHRRAVRQVVWFSCAVMYADADRPQAEDDYDPRAKLHPAYQGAGTTKVYFERMAEWYASLGRTRFTALRHSNIYGPHDKYDLARSHVFGATVTKALTARDGKLVVWGTGAAARDLLHADDLCAAVKAATAQRAPFGLYNVGSGISVTTRDLAERIAAAAGTGLRVALDASKPTIDTRTALDCARFRNEFGWTPKIALDDGIARTIAWWRANRPLGQETASP
jgi:nucleoside-diphosphate-sugar epimerase